MSMRGLGTTIATLLHLALALCACNSVTMTGTGAEVAGRVRAVLLANGEDCASRGPDGVTVHPYGPIGVSDPAQHAGVGSGHLDPSQGKFLFEAMGVDYFDNLRWIEVTITPWDDRPGIKRSVWVNVWHFLYVPPLTPGPDFLLTDIVMDRLRGAGESTSDASVFLASLPPDQRSLASHPFDDPARLHWSYLRGVRPGVALTSLDPAAREKALAIFQSQLSNRGDLTIDRVIQMERYLRQRSIDRGAPDLSFDPTMYFVSIWSGSSEQGPSGAPVTAPSTARLEGHHLSLNFTTEADGTMHHTPLFIGSQPQEVPDGPMKGVRNLGKQQDAFFSLARSLTPAQLDRARMPGAVPRDIVTGPGRERLEGPPKGLPASEMTDEQRTLLCAVLKEYADLLESDLRDHALREMLGDADSDPDPDSDSDSSSALAATHFALAGDIDRSKPHYFRLHGPTLIIEFDCSSGDPDHLHSVWHDPRGGLGVDLLSEHHATAPPATAP